MEQKNISDSINVALKKNTWPVSHSITSKIKQSSFSKSSFARLSFQNLLLQDQAYLFLRQISGSPPYWQKFMYEVVAMIKQLGIPT